MIRLRFQEGKESRLRSGTGRVQKDYCTVIITTYLLATTVCLALYSEDNP